MVGSGATNALRLIFFRLSFVPFHGSGGKQGSSLDWRAMTFLRSCWGRKEWHVTRVRGN
jgi:hypothetical protein